MKDPFKIGLVGLGTVGVGVVKILQQHGELIAKRAGRSIQIIAVSARNKDKDRGVDLSGYEWVDNFANISDHKDLDLVVEMIGGAEGSVKDFVFSSLNNHKHVVTANKALLAHHGSELAQLASANKVSIGYEAAIAGGIPIVKTLREGLAANDIEGIFGILNGTCNYILTEMRETGRDFDDVLKEAQDKGYAEADPTFDVDGIDAAHKLTLLTAIGFGVNPDFDAISITGIRDISADDIKFASDLGYKIKLLGIAKRSGDKILQRMEPCLVNKNSAIGGVEGVFNAVSVKGDFVNEILNVGPGAGEGPTASAIVADIIDIARGNTPPMFGVDATALQNASWADANDIQSACYLHLEVKGHSGVIADVTSVLKDHAVSIEKLIQPGLNDNGTASVVMITRKGQYKDILSGVAALEKLDSIVAKPKHLRLEEV